MKKARKVVWSVADAPMVESPDGGMRDSVLVTDETCGARDVSAGLVWVKPGSEIHEDTHTFDEVYYVIAGRAQLVLAGEASAMKAGDIVYIPNGIRHRIVNPHREAFQIAWIIATRWSSMPDVKAELGRWPTVDPTTGWHSSDPSPVTLPLTGP
jgi:mannose-6-phosphate isomerase-like protein (cupin superfamily)